MTRKDDGQVVFVVSDDTHVVLGSCGATENIYPPRHRKMSSAVLVMLLNLEVGILNIVW